MKSLWSSQNARLNSCLIVGLGNPGTAYEETRHNMGFKVVSSLAKKHGWRLKRDAKVNGAIAQNEDVVLLLPQTYMNLSGDAVERGVKKFKPVRMIVVSDDAALPFGTLRFREGGSSGGHNGLRSIEERLGTQDFPRLRVGVGSPGSEELADYVLGKFTKEEQEALPQVIEQAIERLEEFIKGETRDAKRT